MYSYLFTCVCVCMLYLKLYKRTMIWYSCQRNDVRKALLAKVIIYYQEAILVLCYILDLLPA